MSGIHHGYKRDKTSYVLNMSLFLLVSLQYLQELFVRLRVVRETVLDLAEVVDCVVELPILRFLRLACVETTQKRGVVAATLQSG